MRITSDDFFDIEHASNLTSAVSDAGLREVARKAVVLHRQAARDWLAFREAHGKRLTAAEKEREAYLQGTLDGLGRVLSAIQDKVRAEARAAA